MKIFERFYKSNVQEDESSIVNNEKSDLKNNILIVIKGDIENTIVCMIKAKWMIVVTDVSTDYRKPSLGTGIPSL